ncbi:MAG: hypothetical protein AAFO62_07700, partial [Pseudomonadota bacterium]
SQLSRSRADTCTSMARDMAERLGIPADMLVHVSARLRESCDALPPDADHTEVHAWLKGRAAKG